MRDRRRAVKILVVTVGQFYALITHRESFVIISK